MTQQIIYVPGLGDKSVAGQRFTIRFWRLWGVRPHLYQMNWADGQPYEPKFKGLLNLIDTLAAKGEVSLVGASAGATVVINAYAARPGTVKSVICIAGKINNPEEIGDSYKQQNPAFWESAQQTPTALKQLSPEQKQRILSIYGAVDHIVPAKCSIVEGAHNRRTWTMAHSVTIAVQLLFGAPFFLRFSKAESQQEQAKS